MDELTELPGVDEGDRLFVAAAAYVSGSVLVATDKPLREALSSNCIDVKDRFLIATPTEALRLAEPY